MIVYINIIKIILVLFLSLGVFVTWMGKVRIVSPAMVMKRILVIGMVCCCSCLIGISYHPWRVVEYFGKNIIRFEEMLRYGSFFQEGSDYLEITANKAAPVYLRGMVGVSYSDGIWSDKDVIDEKYDGLFQYLEKQGFYPQNQLCNSLITKNLPKNQITIQHGTASRKHTFAPLLVEKVNSDNLICKQMESNRLVSKSFWGENNYTYQYRAIVDTDIEKYVNNNLSQEYRTNELLYRSFVYDNYLKIPSDKRMKFDAWDLSEVGGTTQKEVIESVKEYCKEKKITEMTDVALLLRYCGIPTRYISGVYIEKTIPNQLTHVSKEDQTHWVEVYYDEIGFVTVNMELHAENTKSTGIVMNTQTEVDQQKNKADVLNDKNVWKVIVIIIVILFVALLLFVIVLLFGIKIRKEKRFYSKNMMEFLSFLCNHLENVLKCDNVMLNVNRPYDYTDVIFSKYGSEMHQFYNWFFQTIDEVLFNHKGLSEMEKERMRFIVKRFEILACENATTIQKLRLGLY